MNSQEVMYTERDVNLDNQSLKKKNGETDHKNQRAIRMQSRERLQRELDRERERGVGRSESQIWGWGEAQGGCQDCGGKRKGALVAKS